MDPTSETTISSQPCVKDTRAALSLSVSDRWIAEWNSLVPVIMRYANPAEFEAANHRVGMPFYPDPGLDIRASTASNPSTSTSSESTLNASAAVNGQSRTEVTAAASESNTECLRPVTDDSEGREALNEDTIATSTTTLNHEQAIQNFVSDNRDAAAARAERVRNAHLEAMRAAKERAARRRGE